MLQVILITVIILFYKPQWTLSYKSSKDLTSLLRSDTVLLTFDYEILPAYLAGSSGLRFNKKSSKVLNINFHFKSDDIPFPQCLNVTHNNSLEIIIFEFSELDDYKLTCIDQYYVAAIPDQTPMCDFVAFLDPATNTKAMLLYNLTYTVGTVDNHQEFFSKLSNQDQKITGFATIFDTNSLNKKVYNTTYNLIWINKTFPIDFPFNIHKLNVIDWVKLFKINCKILVSEFLETLVRYKVSGEILSSWSYEKDISITLNPYTHKIDFIVEIMAKRKKIKTNEFVTIFTSSYYLYFYHIDESKLQNESINKLTGDRFSCIRQIKSFALKIVLFNKTFSKYVSALYDSYEMLAVWPEKQIINFTCSYFSFISYSGIADIYLKRYILSVTKLTFTNCHFLPKYNVMFLPKIFQAKCDCLGYASFLYYTISGNCTLTISAKCHYKFLCYSYLGLPDLTISIKIYSDKQSFFIQRKYKKVSLPWYVSYLPVFPTRTKIITCITNVRYLNLIYHWHCSVSLSVDPLTYKNYYFTNSSQLKFSLYAPDLIHICVCNVKYKNESGHLLYNISKQFYIMLKKIPLERCELQMDLEKPMSLALAYVGIQFICFMCLFLIFPLIAYHMTDKYNFNLKRKQILLSLGIREIIDFNKKLFKPLHISKWRVSDHIYNSVLNLSIEASKKAELLRNFRDKMSVITEKVEESKDDNVDNKNFDKEEMQSIIKKSMRLSQSEMEQIYFSKKIRESINKRKSMNSKDSKKKLKHSLRVRLEYKPRTNNIAKLIKMMEDNDIQEEEKKRDKKVSLKRGTSIESNSTRPTDSILKDVRVTNTGTPKLRFTLSKESESPVVKSSISQKVTPYGVYESPGNFNDVRNILFPKGRSFSDEAISQHKLYRKKSSLSRISQI